MMLKDKNLSYILLKKRTFLPLFITQFLSAFNDNAFKLSMLTLISYHISISQNQSEHYQAWAGAIYILPFFIFSATAGQLADKFDKARLTVWIKAFEILLMLIGSYALFYHQVSLMMLCLLGMGIHSTFFGPIKYSILPDQLEQEELLDATGLIEASTFLAILLGTTLGSLSITRHAHVIHALIIINCAAFLGFISSLYIPPAPAKSTTLVVDWNIWRATKEMLKEIVGYSQILLIILAISWFWLIGAVMLTKLPDYTHYILGADKSVFALFLALFSIGIALGSLAISKLLAGKIILKFVPLAMLFLSIFAFDIYWASPPVVEINVHLLNLFSFLKSLNHLRITIDFFLYSISGGLFIVPLYTYLQVSSPPGKRARTIAVNNIINALFMVIGTLVVMLLISYHMPISLVFLLLAISNAVAAIFVGLKIYKLGLGVFLPRSANQ